MSEGLERLILGVQDYNWGKVRTSIVIWFYTYCAIFCILHFCILVFCILYFVFCISCLCRLGRPARFVNFWFPPASGKTRRWTRGRATLSFGWCFTSCTGLDKVLINIRCININMNYQILNTKWFAKYPNIRYQYEISGGHPNIKYPNININIKGRHPHKDSQQDGEWWWSVIQLYSGWITSRLCISLHQWDKRMENCEHWFIFNPPWNTCRRSPLFWGSHSWLSLDPAFLFSPRLLQQKPSSHRFKWLSSHWKVQPSSHWPTLPRCSPLVTHFNCRLGWTETIMKSDTNTLYRHFPKYKLYMHYIDKYTL